jgi:hypothetical protein
MVSICCCTEACDDVIELVEEEEAEVELCAIVAGEYSSLLVGGFDHTHDISFADAFSCGDEGGKGEGDEGGKGEGVVGFAGCGRGEGLVGRTDVVVDRVDRGRVAYGELDIDLGVIDEGVLDEGVIDEGVIDEGVIDEGVIDEGVIDEGVSLFASEAFVCGSLA